MNNRQWAVGDRVIANVPGEGYLPGIVVGAKGSSKFPYAPLVYRLRVAKNNALTGGMFTCILGKLIQGRDLAERDDFIVDLDEPVRRDK